MGKYPMSCNLASAHSSMLTGSFYDGVLSIIRDPKYLWADVFPGIRNAQTNSKEGTIDGSDKKGFKTLTRRSARWIINRCHQVWKVFIRWRLGEWNRRKLCRKDRLDKLWEKYTNDLKSQKKLGCREIHIATRWSVHDVIGENLNDNMKVIREQGFYPFPDLMRMIKSNFDYMYGVGFDTKYFWDMEKSLDDVSWMMFCLWMSRLSVKDCYFQKLQQLNHYNGALPEVRLGGEIRGLWQGLGRRREFGGWLDCLWIWGRKRFRLSTRYLTGGDKTGLHDRS